MTIRKCLYIASVIFILTGCDKVGLFSKERGQGTTPTKTTSPIASSSNTRHSTTTSHSPAAAAASGKAWPASNLIGKKTEIVSTTRTPGNQRRGETLSVALLVPLLGKDATIGKNMLDAAQLAANELGNSKVNLIAADTSNGGNSTNMLTAAKQADVIIGPALNSQIGVIYPHAKARGITTIALISDSGWKNKDGLYLLGLPDWERADAMLAYASHMGINNIFAILPKGQEGYDIEKVLANRAEGKLLTYRVIRYDSAKGSNDVYNAAISELRNAITSIPNISNSAILLPQTGPELRRILQQLSTAGDNAIKNMRILGGSSMHNTDFSGLKLAKNLWFADVPLGARGDFSNRFSAAYKYKPIPQASLSYDAFALILAVIENVGNDLVFDPNTLMSNFGFEGINGVFKFKSDGTSKRLLSIFRINNNGQPIELQPAGTAFTG